MNKKWNTITKHIIASIFVIFSISFAQLMPSDVIYANEDGQSNQSNESIREVIESIINWKKSNLNLNTRDDLLSDLFLENAGSSGVDWLPIGMGRIGYPDDYNNYLTVIQDVVEKRYEEDNKLSRAKATEWHRISLAILSSGGDPTNVGKTIEGEPINLIADGTYDRGLTNSLGAQGLNGWIWGLITLDSFRYIVPDNAHTNREEIIEEILSAQLEDGGFSLILIEKETNIDITAMAIQALAPYYNSEKQYTYEQKITKNEVTKTVREVVDEAIETLSKLQLPDGDFEIMTSPNAESTAQMIVALTSLGINPLEDERFIKNGNTLLDGLLKYQMEDGGFTHSESYDLENPTSLPNESNAMASDQSLYALSSILRLKEGHRNLYDFRQEMNEELHSEIASLNESIDQLPKEITEQDRERVNDLFSYYMKIPVFERSYVYSYAKLADAMETLDINNDSEFLEEYMGENSSGNGSITPIFNETEDFAEELIFSEVDANRAEALLEIEEVTTEHRIEILNLIELLETATNKADFNHYLEKLNEKKERIEELEADIDSLNKDITQQLYPFDEISVRDKEAVDNIMERYEILTSYDQEKIVNYEDVEKAEVQIAGLIRARYITLFVGLLVLTMSVILLKRHRTRRKKKKEQEMQVEEI